MAPYIHRHPIPSDAGIDALGVEELQTLAQSRDPDYALTHFRLRRPNSIEQEELRKFLRQQRREEQRQPEYMVVGAVLKSMTVKEAIELWHARELAAKMDTSTRSQFLLDIEAELMQHDLDERIGRQWVFLLMDIFMRIENTMLARAVDVLGQKAKIFFQTSDLLAQSRRYTMLYEQNTDAKVTSEILSSYSAEDARSDHDSIRSVLREWPDEMVRDPDTDFLRARLHMYLWTEETILHSKRKMRALSVVAVTTAAAGLLKRVREELETAPPKKRYIRAESPSMTQETHDEVFGWLMGTGSMGGTLPDDVERLVAHVNKEISMSPHAKNAIIVGPCRVSKQDSDTVPLSLLSAVYDHVMTQKRILPGRQERDTLVFIAILPGHCVPGAVIPMKDNKNWSAVVLDSRDDELGLHWVRKIIHIIQKAAYSAGVRIEVEAGVRKHEPSLVPMPVIQTALDEMARENSCCMFAAAVACDLARGVPWRDIKDPSTDRLMQLRLVAMASRPFQMPYGLRHQKAG